MSSDRFYTSSVVKEVHWKAQLSNQKFEKLCGRSATRNAHLSVENGETFRVDWWGDERTTDATSPAQGRRTRYGRRLVTPSSSNVHTWLSGDSHKNFTQSRQFEVHTYR